MPDIMMCDAGGCKLSAGCRRHTDSGTVPSEYRQSYWMRDDAGPNGDDCNNYWPMRSKQLNA